MGLRRIIRCGYELTDMQRGSKFEAFDVQMGDHLEDIIRDLGQESF